jgi:Tfp pilus assembly protein PilO
MIISANNRKNVIRALVIVILLLDAVLIALNWRLSTTPGTDPARLMMLRTRRDLMAGDIRRALDIRKGLPSVQAQADDFFQKDLRSADAVHSSVVADLSVLAKDAGLQITSTRFRERAIEKRGVNELTVSISIQGAYPSLVSFINGLERSHNFYLLDSLNLDSSSEGTLRLNLELRTYFRI